jgi:hypothetical protein
VGGPTAHAETFVRRAEAAVRATAAAAGAKEETMLRVAG